MYRLPERMSQTHAQAFAEQLLYWLALWGLSLDGTCKEIEGYAPSSKQSHEVDNHE